MSLHEHQAGEKESSLEALKEMGSLPVHFLRWINEGFDSLHKAGMPRPLKLKSLALVISCAALLAACGEPLSAHSSVYHAGDDMRWEATREAAVATQKAAGEYPFDDVFVPQLTPTPTRETDGLRPYSPEATYFWRFNVTVQSGEGIWAAFVRGAIEKGYRFSWVGTVPEGMTEVVEIWRDDRLVEIHSLRNVLENNPTVHPGDMLIHTFVNEESLGNMLRSYGLTAESAHIP